MNGIKLFELCEALAPLMPSEAAISKASIEWRLAREAWLSALKELNLPEETVREMSGRRLKLTGTRGPFQ